MLLSVVYYIYSNINEKCCYMYCFNGMQLW